MPDRKPLRALVIGLAGRGCVWAQAIEDHPQFTLAGLADLDRDVLEKVGGNLDVPAEHQFTDYNTAVATGGFDVAFCIASTLAHFKIVTDLLNADMHCLVEKPFTLDMDQARQLVDLADEKQRVLVVGQNYRFDAVRHFVAQAVREEVLGKLTAVTGQFYRHRPPRPQDAAIPYPLLFIQSIHHLDWLISMLGAPSAVHAVHALPPSSEWQSPSVCHMQMRCGDVAVSYCGSYETQGEISPYGGLWRFEFADGDILIDHDEVVWRVTGQGEIRERMFTPGPDDKPSEAALLDSLYAGIVDNIDPPTSGSNNLTTLQLIFDVIAAGER